MKKTSSKKLGKSQYPPNHSPNDFSCYGPIATKDGEFEGTKLADLACFKQDKIDTNKFYHAAVVKSKLTDDWYVFFSWGRVGGKQDFQFQPCSSEQEAQQEYEKQLHKKNDKRGVWEEHPILGKILRAKPNKDVYLVSSKVNRSVSLPDAKNIGVEQSTTEKIKRKSSIIFDSEADKLLQDLNAGTIDYTRTSIVGGDIPSQDAINQAKQILDVAVSINNGLKTQKQRLENKELYDLSQLLYSKIPKYKSRHAEKEDWMLLPNNIQKWQDDLDAFDNALQNTSFSNETRIYSFSLLTLPFNSDLGKFYKTFAEKSTRNRHSYVKNLKVKNIWKVERKSQFSDYQNKIIVGNKVEKPLHQVSRIDVNDDKLYQQSNTNLLFHGTKTVNVGGILEKSFILPNYKNNITITGAMFGSPAVYFADDIKKSIGYTSYHGSYWAGGSGGIKNRGAFIFICDVILGNIFIAPRAHAYHNPPNNHHSIMGKAGYSGVQNNEFIVFDVNQCYIRALLEVE